MSKYLVFLSLVSLDFNRLNVPCRPRIPHSLLCLSETYLLCITKTALRKIGDKRFLAFLDNGPTNLS